MAEMTKADWDLKDRRIVRQSMLKAAVEYISSRTESTHYTDILDLAEIFVDFVYEVKQEDEAPEKIYPTPTNDQKQGLKEVEKATGWTKEQVWDKFGKYPVLANAHICIKKINEEKEND